jgi:hypothetical protein
MKLKGLMIVLMLLGVIGLEAKPKYRIETWVDNGTKYYLPQRKVWFRTNYFTLPIKVWVSGAYPFQHKFQAEEIIQNWKDDYQAKKEYRRSEYIIVE